MLKKLTPTLLCLGLAGLALLGPLPSAKAQQAILVFGQNGTTATLTATNSTTSNPTQNQTTLAVTNAPISITAIAPNGGSTPISAFLTLNATSTGAASQPGGPATTITQPFSGSFSITDGGTTNYLSGTFTDAVVGSGNSFDLHASNIPGSGETVTFTSNVITTLGNPLGISLSLTSVVPPGSMTGNSLGNFTASVAGNFSATPAVPEPGPIALLLSAVPTLGLYLARRGRSRA